MGTSNYWVVDASVALKWYFRDEEFFAQADSLLEAFSMGVATLTAPSLICHEITNAFVVANRRGRLSSEQVLLRLRSFLALHIAQPADDEEALVSAVQFTTQFPVAFYDALYLAMAQRLAYGFVTADQRLHEHIKDALPWAVWIGNLEAKA